MPGPIPLKPGENGKLSNGACLLMFVFPFIGAWTSETYCLRLGGSVSLATPMPLFYIKHIFCACVNVSGIPVTFITKVRLVMIICICRLLGPHQHWGCSDPWAGLCPSAVAADCHARSRQPQRIVLCLTIMVSPVQLLTKCLVIVPLLLWAMWSWENWSSGLV